MTVFQSIRLPAEWEPHARTWMAWPARAATWGNGIAAARAAHVEVARALAVFEPVTMVCNPADLVAASLQCGPGIDLVPIPVSDGWMRDIGPSFVIDGQAGLAGVDWMFNGWGGLHDAFAADAEMAREILKLRDTPRRIAPMVLEGGAFSTDGAGTLLVTEECLLDPRRNPSKTRAGIEAILAELLGVRTVIWLGRGYEGDETRGHVDEIACFVRPGTVLLQMPADPADPNYLIQHDNLARLKSARDAAGRPLDIVDIPQPARRETERGRLTLSYINFAFANDGIVMPSFGDAADAGAYKIFTGLFPDRRIIPVLADDLVSGGGGIHCITLQEPAV
jgi:agmatine deiminase